MHPDGHRDRHREKACPTYYFNGLIGPVANRRSTSAENHSSLPIQRRDHPAKRRMPSERADHLAGSVGQQDKCLHRPQIAGQLLGALFFLQ